MTEPTTGPALEITGLNKNFGALQVAKDIHFSLDSGARHALIGPNGAGKTTFVNLITGALRPTAGTVRLYNSDITHLTQAERAQRGIARTFQINQLFRGITVLENVCLAITERTGDGNSLWRPAGSKPAVIDEAVQLLDRVQLTDDALKTVNELPYGRQRLVEIAIALGQQPTVLLLDEPAAGVPSAESHIILDVVDGLGADIAVLIIEHDMEVVFRFARAITVLVAGAILTAGDPDTVAADPRVREVYLGGSNHG